MFVVSGNRYLGEEKGEHREDGRLDEPDEYLKGHQRDGQEERDEEHRNHDEDFPREDVSEKTEGERNEAGYFGYQLDGAYHEVERRGEIKKFLPVADTAEKRDAGNLDSEESDDGECEGEIEVGCWRIQ